MKGIYQNLARSHGFLKSCLQMLRATIICCLLGSMLHPSVQGAQVDARNARQFHQQAQVQQQQYAVPQERQGLG